MKETDAAPVDLDRSHSWFPLHCVIESPTHDMIEDIQFHLPRPTGVEHLLLLSEEVGAEITAY
jgi:hypothetical protein